jgi:radical SAM-linked protein
MSRRLRITYRHGVQCTVQPGALARAWVEAFEAAGLPLERPAGSRKPRVETGPALPVGATGEREVFDAWLADATPSPEAVCSRLASTAPAGLLLLAAEEIGERLPSLSSSVRSANYRVDFPPGVADGAVLAARVASLLALRTLEVEEVRGERVRRMDLRAVVLALAVVGEEHGRVRLDMRLALEQERTGRPMTVLTALGCGGLPHTLVRSAIEVETPRVALRAWRERGRFA